MKNLQAKKRGKFIPEWRWRLYELEIERRLATIAPTPFDRMVANELGGLDGGESSLKGWAKSMLQELRK